MAFPALAAAAGAGIVGSILGNKRETVAANRANDLATWARAASEGELRNDANLAMLQIDWGSAQADQHFRNLMDQQQRITQATSESAEQQLGAGYNEAQARQQAFAGRDYTGQQQALLQGGYGSAMGSISQGYDQALGLQPGQEGMRYIQQGQEGAAGAQTQGLGQQLGALGGGAQQALALQGQGGQQALNYQGQGAQQALGYQGLGGQMQQSAIMQALQGAQMAGQPYGQTGAAGLNAFANSAMANPYDNIAFQQRLSQGQEAINRQLAARGLYNSGAGIQAQSDFASQITGEEQQNQIARQLQLAQMGQQQSGMTQAQLMQGGGALADIFGGTAQMQAGIAERYGANAANIAQGTAMEQAGVAERFGAGQAGAYGQTANNLSGIFERGGAALAGQANFGQGQQQQLLTDRAGQMAQLQLGQAGALSGLFDTRYAQEAANVAAQNQLALGRGTDMANIQAARGNALNNIYGQGINAQANNALNAAQARANIWSNLGSNIANAFTGQATQQANVAMQLGQSQANRYSDLGTAIGMGAMQYQQNKDYNQTLKDIYGKKV